MSRFQTAPAQWRRSRVIAATVQEQSGIETSIKPPNDVYIADRKIAGVLVEMRVIHIDSNTCDRAVAATALHAHLDENTGDFPVRDVDVVGRLD